MHKVSFTVHVMFDGDGRTKFTFKFVEGKGKKDATFGRNKIDTKNNFYYYATLRVMVIFYELKCIFLNVYYFLGNKLLIAFALRNK